MRKRISRKRNKFIQYNIFIIFMLTLFFISIGYSLFNETLKIEGKSNIQYNLPSGDYEVVITLVNSWGSFPNIFYQYKIELTNNSAETMEGWKITIEVPEDTTIASNANNAENELKDGIIEFTNKDYNKTILPGGTVSFEFQITTSEKNLNIDSAIVNGGSTGGNTQIPPTGITIDPIDMIIHVGENAKISASLIPQNAVGTITWTSSNENVATVDKKGNVTAVTEGNTVITATINGLSQQCNVEVLSRIIQKVLIITFTKSNSWESNGIYYSQYTVELENISNSNISSWAFDLQLPEDSTLASYNTKVTQNANIFSIYSESYNGSIAIGGKVSIVIQVESPISDYELQATNINVK